MIVALSADTSGARHKGGLSDKEPRAFLVPKSKGAHETEPSGTTRRTSGSTPGSKSWADGRGTCRHAPQCTHAASLPVILRTLIPLY